MSAHKSITSDSTKAEIAKELGVYDKVMENGWRDVSSKDCGNIVKLALERTKRLDNDEK